MPEDAGSRLAECPPPKPVATFNFPSPKIHDEEKNYRLITSDFNKGCLIT